jgi:protein required for attachment to host cells
MQLPQELQKFPTLTLIAVADSVAAKLYLAEGDNLEAAASVTLPREKKQDNEGSFTSADGSRTGGPVDEDDAPRLNAFIRQTARAIIDLMRSRKPEHLDLVMPAEMEHALSAELPSDVDTLIRRRLHKDLMKEAPVELVKRLLET